MLYLLIFSGSLLSVIFFTPFLISVLTKLQIVDYPGGRKKHTTPVPRMGGLLLYIMLVISLSLFCNDNNTLRFLIYSSGLIVLCGILDDAGGLKWYIKYIMQSAAAIIIIFYMNPSFNEISLFGIVFPGITGSIVLYFFITGVINSVNMLDGLDGLVSGAGLLLFMLIFMLSYITQNVVLMIIAASLTGSLIGFLKFNAFPAKIFLGDTGSLMIGFFLAFSAITLAGSLNTVVMDLTFPIILLGVPVLDTLKVMGLRIYNHKSPFQPDRSHIHHRIQDNNIHHKHTVFIIQLFTVMFISTAVYYHYYNRLTAAILFALLSAVFVGFNPIHRYLIGLISTATSWIPMFYNKKFTLNLYRKILLPGSSIIIMLIVLFIFPSEVDVAPEVIAMMIAVYAFLLAAAVLSFRRDHGLNDMYVLLNLFIFFALSDGGEPYLKFFRIAELNNYLLLDIAVAAILVFVGLFLLFRERIFGGRVSLFSGIDLIMLVLVLSIITLQYLVPQAIFGISGLNLLTGFIIYIWYKMVMLILPVASRRIYVIIFMLPVAMLLSIAW